MKKKRAHTTWSWIKPFLITLFVTWWVLAIALYGFKIPFYLWDASDRPIEDTSWTPREIELVKDEIIPPPSEPQKMCTMEYAPVCGDDKRDYSNACMAESAWVGVAYTGSCRPDALTSPLPSIIATETVSSEEKIFDTGSYQIYENKSFGYSVAMPKFAWYQWLGARDGSSHALAVGLSSTGAEDTNADVVVYFYKTSPANPPLGSQQIILANGSVYIVKNGSGPKVDQIIETIQASAK